MVGKEVSRKENIVMKKKNIAITICTLIMILFFLPTIIGIGHCIWNENRFFGDRFHLSGIYLETGVEIDDWKVHCVYEDEDGLTFEMISWNGWQVPMLIANRRNACTYVYSVQEACREEVNLLNEEYANRISIRNEYQDYSRSSSIYPLGVTEEEAWEQCAAEYISRLDAVYDFYINDEEGFADTFHQSGMASIIVNHRRIPLSLTEEKLSHTDVINLLREGM